jgi:hypothetical protein
MAISASARRQRRHLKTLLALIVAAALLGALGLFLACRFGIACPFGDDDRAELSAAGQRVTYRSSAGAAEEAVLPGTRRDVRAGDAFDVDASGEAWLRFKDFLLVRVFRDSILGVLEFQSEVAKDAPAIYRTRLEAGTMFNTLTASAAAARRVRVETRWAVVEALGTEFLVHYDPRTEATWVVVKQGAVSAAAAGQEVTVPARWQTWVEPNRPPESPLPATRAAVGSRFRLVDELTNGALRDGDFLEPAPTPTSTPTPT